MREEANDVNVPKSFSGRSCCSMASFGFAQGPVIKDGDNLPAPMSSAINRIAQPDKQPELKMPGLILGGAPTVRVVEPVEPCSIPLLEYKIPAKPKFFMPEVREPKGSTEPMPVIRAKVCKAP